MKILRTLTTLLLFVTGAQLVCGYRILGLFPLHSKSHFQMTHELMKGLAERGHQVDVVSHFPLEKPIPNYRHISLAGTMPSPDNSLTYNNMTSYGLLTFRRFITQTGHSFCKLLSQPKMQDLINNPPNDPPYDLVVTEIFATPCYLAFGRLLKVPTVGVIVTTFFDWLNYRVGNPLNTAVTPSSFPHSASSEGFWNRFGNTLRSIITIGLFDYFLGNLNDITKKYFGPDTPDVRDMQSDISLFLVNSHHSLHGVRPWTQAIVEVAGLHINRNDDVPLDGELKKFLDNATHGCVYFSFGSMIRIETFPNETINALYKSFEKIAPVRVVMKVAKKEDLLPGLPKNVMVRSWLPQIAILKHKNTKVFITHGGSMGTMESISYGVPMIGIPLFGDQLRNIQIYAQKKVAVSLNSYKEITEESLTKALNAVLKDPSYKKNAERLGKVFLDRPLSPIDTAIYWIEYVVKYGNVLRSPLLRLSWWQRNLLDVYGLMLLIVLSAFYVVLVVFRVLKKCLVKIFSKKVSVPKSAKKGKRA